MSVEIQQARQRNPSVFLFILSLTLLDQPFLSSLLLMSLPCPPVLVEVNSLVSTSPLRFVISIYLTYVSDYERECTFIASILDDDDDNDNDYSNCRMIFGPYSIHEAFIIE